MAGANLDALIPREDFEVATPPGSAIATATLQVRDLEQTAFFYGALRKPDFQRETNEWEPQRIADFVKSFLDGDLIPAIILWKSNTYCFVIDGAHRLSTLIAWVNDDYGDGSKSRFFFNDAIPEGQKMAAHATRDLIAKTIGSYQQYKLAIEAPNSASPDVLAKARDLGTLAIQLQWVTGDAKKAESSFFKINQSAAPIDKTELRLLKARRRPDAIAARAIMRAGTGHKYWSMFDGVHQKQIEQTAGDIYSTLFHPELRTPIKTLELPAAGRGYASETLSLVVDFVGLANNGPSGTDETEDTDGIPTVEHLDRCRRVAQLLAGKSPGSLALHPAVYYYSTTGRYQPAAFLAAVAFVLDLQKESRLDEFTRCRAVFENSLISLKMTVNQIVRKLGAGLRSHRRIAQFYRSLMTEVQTRPQADPLELVAQLRKHSDLSFIDPGELDTSAFGRDFSVDSKSAVFLREALANATTCGICGARIHGGGITIDHKKRKQDGGLGDPLNGQLAHPYCNTTFKN